MEMTTATTTVKDLVSIVTNLSEKATELEKQVSKLEEENAALKKQVDKSEERIMHAYKDGYGTAFSNLANEMQKLRDAACPVECTDTDPEGADYDDSVPVEQNKNTECRSVVYQLFAFGILDEHYKEVIGDLIRKRYSLRISGTEPFESGNVTPLFLDCDHNVLTALDDNVVLYESCLYINVVCGEEFVADEMATTLNGLIETSTDFGNETGISYVKYFE